MAGEFLLHAADDRSSTATDTGNHGQQLPATDKKSFRESNLIFGFNAVNPEQVINKNQDNPSSEHRRGDRNRAFQQSINFVRKKITGNECRQYANGELCIKLPATEGNKFFPV